MISFKIWTPFFLLMTGVFGVGCILLLIHKRDFYWKKKIKKSIKILVVVITN